MTDVKYEESDFEESESEETSPEMKELEALMKPFGIPDEEGAYGCFGIVKSTIGTSKGKTIGVGFSWFYGNHGDDVIYFTNDPFRVLREEKRRIAQFYHGLECRHNYMVRLEELPKKQRKEMFGNCLCADSKEVGKVLSSYLKYPEDEPGDWYTIVHIEIKLAENEYDLEVEKIFFAYRLHGENQCEHRPEFKKEQKKRKIIDITDSVVDDIIDLTLTDE